MDTPLRKLTLTCPKAGAISILDALDDIEPNLPGYTFIDGQGRGPQLDYMNASEKVQGAMRVVLIVIILPESQIEDVLAVVKAVYHRPQLSYWVEPVLDFGKLQ
jgi:nitrogen regulatory protein PII